MVAMADPRYPYWIAEQQRGYRGPTTAGTLALFAVITLVLLALLGGPSAYAEHVERGTRHHGSLCAEHQGRPGWDAVCKEHARR
jgi:hypothetical protein